MAFDAHANLTLTSVATAPSPATTGTSLIVTAGTGTNYPTPPFNCVVWPSGSNPTKANAEIVRVTAISTDTFTITRAQESTTAQSIAVGWQIANVMSAKTFTDIESLIGIASYAIFTSSGSWTVPSNVSRVHIRAIGGGGGGGANTAGASATGGGGGGAGAVIDTTVTVTSGHTLTITIGAGDPGHLPGWTSTGGGTTTVSDGGTTLVQALGGGGSAYTDGGGYGLAQYGTGGVSGADNLQITIPGFGGMGNQFSGAPFIAVVGGAGGGASNASAGGGAGNAQQSGSALTAQLAGSAGASGSINGTVGVSATMPGCGGGGAGTAYTGGTVYAGGAGAAGQVELWW